MWGYDYYGGTRTVDVHIRRLRAKLGGEYEHLIGTVRNVGYRFDPPSEEMMAATAKADAAKGKGAGEADVAKGATGNAAQADAAKAASTAPVAPAASATVKAA